MKYIHKVERTWQEGYSNKEQMCALINGWERWEPDGDLKKGKELLSTNWTIIEKNKRGKARREGGEDKNNDGWDDDNGYHSDKYNICQETMICCHWMNQRMTRRVKRKTTIKTVQGRLEITRRRRRTKK